MLMCVPVEDAGNCSRIRLLEYLSKTERSVDLPACEGTHGKGFEDEGSFGISDFR